MKLIILDRDGVINFESKHYIKTPDEWLPIPGSLEAMAQLCQGGFTIAIATNQSGIARGLYDVATLESIHQKLHASVAQLGGFVDFICYCPHHPEDHCHCRKPKPGLLQQISHHYQINLKGVPLVGDSLRDLQAGHAMDCQCVLVETGNGLDTLRHYQRQLTDVAVYADLQTYVAALLAE